MEKCFADKSTYCTALNIRNCKGCEFFRTKRELEVSRDKAERRIDSLPKTTRDYIYGKYFKGEK